MNKEKDPKEMEKETPEGNGQPEEKTTEPVDDTTKTEGNGKENVEEKVEISKSELEKLQKYKADFDGIIEKKRLEKLSKTSEQKPVEGDDELKNELNNLRNEIQSIRAEKSVENLKAAYQEFSKDLPWATSEEYFNKISENFSTDGLNSKEAIMSKLKAVTIDLFPEEYAKHKEAEIKSKALAEANKINVAGNFGGGSNAGAKDGINNDPLAKLKERFASTLPKGYSADRK